jgi:hypothetical protein
LARHESTARLLLVLDQLEEVFTLAGPDLATQLVELVTVAARRTDSRVTIVATLRSDFYDAAARVPGMAALLSRVQFVVPTVDGEQVEEAILGPARRADLVLEPGLLARILTDVAGQPGSLPLLQHLLHALWERRVGQALTRGVYADLGGVGGALANRAESIYAGLDREQRTIARHVLLRAVQPGEDGTATRRPVPASEWFGPTDLPEEVEDVVGRLVDARLLTRDAIRAATNAPSSSRTRPSSTDGHGCGRGSTRHAGGCGSIDA